MSEENPVAEMLEAHLEAITQEIDRLTSLAAREDDSARRQQYWELARDAQAEARKLREEFAARSLRPTQCERKLQLAAWLKALMPCRRHA